MCLPSSAQKYVRMPRLRSSVTGSKSSPPTGLSTGPTQTFRTPSLGAREARRAPSGERRRAGAAFAVIGNGLEVVPADGALDRPDPDVQDALSGGEVGEALPFRGEAGGPPLWGGGGGLGGGRGGG